MTGPADSHRVAEGQCMTMDATRLPESKALRLARYLKEFVGLRTNTVLDLNKYDLVLWFGEMGRGAECHSPAWAEGYAPGDPWLVVRKQLLPKPPAPPDILLPWIDEQALRRAGAEAPGLLPTMLLPTTLEPGWGQDPPLIGRRLEDHPEIARAYDAYRPLWLAWSEDYLRRSRVQKTYASLFNVHTQLQKRGEIVELVLGLGLLAWRDPSKPKSAQIVRHVVTARVDLQFDAETGIMRLRGAADGIQLRIEDDMLEADRRPDRTRYAALGEQLKAIGEDVWDRPRMVSALTSWAEAIHPGIAWSPDLKSADSGADAPVLSFSPALILRNRNQGGMIRIYEGLIEQLARTPDGIPSGWMGLVDDEAGDHPGLSASEGEQPLADPRPMTGEIYFPLPANREQRRIVEALRRGRGVLVQGPPGTGKTHTIANLVCHLLATGQRVLITAETARALKTVRDKLPEAIRPLCVSLLGQGGDAQDELNAAVQSMTTRFATWRPGAYDERIAEIEGDLDAARLSLAQIDTALRSLRADETSATTLPGGVYSGSPSAIARRVAQERERYGWLSLPRDAPDEPPVTQAGLEAWLRHRRHGDESAITAAERRLVGTDRLIPPAAFAAAMSEERVARDALIRAPALRTEPAYRAITALSAEARETLARALRALKDARQTLLRSGHPWVVDALAEASEGRRARWHALFEQSSAWVTRSETMLAGLGAHTVKVAVRIDARVIRADAAAVIAHLEKGGKWTAFGMITPKAVKDRTYLRHQITVDGRAPDTPAALAILCQHLDLTIAFEELASAWRGHGGLPEAASPRIRIAAIEEQVRVLGAVLEHATRYQHLLSTMAATMPGVPAPDWLEHQADMWLELVDSATLEESYATAAEKLNACLPEVKAIAQFEDAHPVVGLLAQAVERRNLAAYSQAYELIRQIEQIGRERARCERTQAVLAAVLPGLADAVASSLGDARWDARFADWERAWRWAAADAWLVRRADPSYREQLWQRRHDIDEAIRALLAESAALRAWTHVFTRLTPVEAASLRSWREAVKAMGMGTGRSARMERLRREARQYMEQCRDAIPVWIMPRYLVADMVDPGPGRYDTVIVDEASQLGIDGLFLFYIARKMIVVGDDQQISPYGVGIADSSIASLQHRYLDGMPHRHALSAQSSLYGNAKIRFGQPIVLREHFRCMPEIIQFSNDLCYANNGTPLDPLRAYPAGRLKPLVVRHVPDGYRTGGSQNALNEPEADTLIAQILGCLADARYTGRSMGVISLQGDAQARLIEHKLQQALEPEVIAERRLMCGDAYAFQGDERSIIFLSMVAAPGETRIGALSNEAARQRFNVAVSRAEDQLWLFHSATLDVLSRACMRHRLLSYMLHPGRKAADEQSQRFEFQFERDVFAPISERGFHVRTQVSVGDSTHHRYRIDLVVEGMQGRLAVECDGEDWHGPERYEQDMARQRDLERAGWRFVRIRGGDFYRDPESACQPLWQELDRLGIRPGGIDDAAAEPPSPVEPQALEAVVAEEGIIIAAGADAAEEGAGEPDGTEAPHKRDVLLSDYVAYGGAACPDPRTVSLGAVADGLCAIIEVEGPVLAKRAYDLYLRGCGIRRLGSELRSTMDKALASAIRQGRVVSENEPGKSGLILSTVRLKGSPPVWIRSRGPRSFEELPPAEVRALGHHLAEVRHLDPGSDEHLRAILDCYDLRRLTTQAATTRRRSGSWGRDAPLA
jgi:very-short-patch-repair endonuclease